MNELNKRITFLRNEIITNENGFSTEKEVEFYSCWSNYKTLSGKEFNSAYTTNSKITVSFKVRTCNKVKDIDTTYKVKYNNKVYNVVYIDDCDEDYYYIKCEVVV